MVQSSHGVMRAGRVQDKVGDVQDVKLLPSGRYTFNLGVF